MSLVRLSSLSTQVEHDQPDADDGHDDGVHGVRLPCMSEENLFMAGHFFAPY